MPSLYDNALDDTDEIQNFYESFCRGLLWLQIFNDINFASTDADEHWTLSINEKEVVKILEQVILVCPVAY